MEIKWTHPNPVCEAFVDEPFIVADSTVYWQEQDTWEASDSWPDNIRCGHCEQLIKWDWD